MSSIFRIILDAEFSPTVMTFPACLGSISHFDPKHKFYQAGAQMILDDEEDDSLDAENDKKQTSKNDGGDETISFLDKAKEDEGDRSVIFVCFGTSFWPPTNQQTKVFLSALEESGLRVLLVPCQVDEEVKEVSAEWAEKMGEKAMMSDWAPQWEILAHPVTQALLDWQVCEAYIVTTRLPQYLSHMEEAIPLKRQC